MPKKRSAQVQNDGQLSLDKKLHNPFRKAINTTFGISALFVWGSFKSPINACALPCFISIPGESVEENANVVVKLLIRRPECFGPALRGEGGQGLLAAMKEAIKISEDPALDLPKTPTVVTTG